jgi:hypothetical protein
MQTTTLQSKGWLQRVRLEYTAKSKIYRSILDEENESTEELEILTPSNGAQQFHNKRMVC